MNNIEDKIKRLSKLDNKNSNSNDEHNCYCDDDNYYETLIIKNNRRIENTK